MLNGPWVCNAEVCESPVHAPLPAPVMAHASAEREHPIAISALTRLAAPAEGQRQQRCTAAILARQLLQYRSVCQKRRRRPRLRASATPTP